MNKIVISISLVLIVNIACGDIPGIVKFGNAVYVNLGVGESFTYLGKTIEVLELQNGRSLIQVNNKKTWFNVARRSLPKNIEGVRVFVADQINAKNITTNTEVHNLLNKQVLLCISNPDIPLLDPLKFIFPISRQDGYRWTMEEDSHMFAYLGHNQWSAPNTYRSHEGIDLNMHDARGKALHPLVAIESSTVVLVADSTITKTHDGCIILKSNTQENIYYVYKHTNPTTHKVKAGQKVEKGDLLSYIWGDNKWGHLHFAVVHRNDTPGYDDRYHNALNFFPQLYELYEGSLTPVSRTYEEGHFEFDQPRWLCKNYKKLDTFDEKTGYGWKLDPWCISGKVESVQSNMGGNARLWHIIHEGTPAASENPASFYDFEVAVPNGFYRVSATMGDLLLPSGQKIYFENAEVGEFETDKGIYQETQEMDVEVMDNKLTIRVELLTGKKCAGIRTLNFKKITP